MKKLINNYLIKLLFPIVQKDIKELEERYQHNYWLVELHYAKLMKAMQQKYGTLFKDSWETYISVDNPFRKELDL